MTTPTDSGKEDQDIPNPAKTDTYDRKPARPKSQYPVPVHKHNGPRLSQ